MLEGSWFSWGTLEQRGLAAPELKPPAEARGGREEDGAGGGEPAGRLSFVCKILITAGQAAVPPEHEGEIATFARLENHRASCQGAVAWAVPTIPEGHGPMWGSCRQGGLPEQGGEAWEKRGGKLREAPLSWDACSKVAKAVPGSALPPNMPGAEGEARRGHGRSGDPLSILQPSPSGSVKERGRGGQQGSGSASACSASRLPPSLPQPSPSSLLCVWQPNAEAPRGSGWRIARTPGSLGCSLFLLLAAGRSRFQA